MGKSAFAAWRCYRVGIFSHDWRVDSGLDSWDSSRFGLGLSPVTGCRLPLKVRGRLMRVEIDSSDPGSGLILGDFLAQNSRDFSVASIELGPRGARIFS